MARIVRRSSLMGLGCLMQFLGLVSLGAALLTLATIIGPIVFGVLGLWLIFAGSGKATWRECSDCGTRLAHRKVKVCPACKATLD